ncbi:hypothetical protein K505DRAFT_404299 [Melanomma pulvis-pyrius CBS 109.77]|uniref:F-box domain-containing protein n=1 Tax=Melanomma pulvis-pyrius CBS 109.77 TaxID=1314802 RepID=A0A6A6XV77_9PLEO|nr:hypothetical protein K505DRAFT_404299 [Melanomma pulvis-pyrius CBS 109.77]
MAPALPDDILHLLCEELALQERFDTLFSCACASRGFAVPALTHLYRSHHLAPVRGGGDDEAVPLATKQLTVQRWSILWRSIIASSLDDTLFPYCRYIKTLDFRDLYMLLDDDQFKGKVTKYFFAGLLSRFHLTLNITYPSGRKVKRLDIVPIIDAIGEVVTQHTPMLEKISGELLTHALIRWSPRLPRLEALEMFDGSPLQDELVHSSIQQHCPQFNSLSIFTWSAQDCDRDHMFSKFIGTIRPQSLRMIETIRDIGTGAETFLALNNHSESLKDLRLCVSDDTLPHLSLLQGCTALEALRIEDSNGMINLEKTQNDVFLEMIDWLRKCSNLRRLSFTKLLSAACIVAPLLMEDSIKLRRLEIDSYMPKDNRIFHQALAHQRASLRILSLSGDTEGMFRDDIDILVDSLKQLTQLRELRLLLVQEVFQDEHLISIIDNLPRLEDLYVSGLEIKDGVLDAVGGLRNLRSVAFSGISKFTTDGLFDFIDRLGPGNLGMRVMVDMADPDTLLTDDEVALVRDSLVEKVGGTLEYTPWRDPNVSEFEGESD